MFHLSPFHPASSTCHASLHRHASRSPQNFLSSTCQSLVNPPRVLLHLRDARRPSRRAWEPGSVDHAAIGAPGEPRAAGTELLNSEASVSTSPHPPPHTHTHPRRFIPGTPPVQPALTAHGMEGTARLLLETFAQFENPLTTVQVREPRRSIHSRPLPRARPRPPAVTAFPSSCTGRGRGPELWPLRARLSRRVRPPPGAPRVPIGCLETAAPPLACGPAPPLAPSPALSPLSRVATHAARRTGPRCGARCAVRVGP